MEREHAGRPCTVCTRPDVAELEGAIACGHTKMSVAKRFGISRGTLNRHLRHTPLATITSAKQRVISSTSQVQQRITRQWLRDNALKAHFRTDSAQEQMVEQGDLRGATSATSAIVGVLSFLRDLDGADQPTIPDLSHLAGQSPSEVITGLVSGVLTGQLDLSAAQALMPLVTRAADADDAQMLRQWLRLVREGANPVQAAGRITGDDRLIAVADGRGDDDAHDDL